LRPRSEQMNVLQEKRDQLNQKIGIPLYRIRELIVEVYNNLTDDVDFFQVPSLQREEEQFAWFFELQAMHAVALQADAAHKEFISLVREQKKAVKDLKITENKQSEVRAELIGSEPILANITTEFSEARQFDQNAHSLNKVIQERRREMRQLRREKGRLDAWARISAKGTTSRKPGNKDRTRKQKSGQADWKPRNRGPRPEEVQQRAATGGALSLSDLDVLLNSGGLASVGASKPTPKSNRRAERKKKQNRNLTVRRGERSQSKKGRKE
ncbi:MAG: hypothetical protein P8R00_06235, partial [Candidatus Poseidoniaceae archaeon]|nr:hypothetical protein [Candidatus Poseidoniaceae archaeon]